MAQIVTVQFVPLHKAEYMFQKTDFPFQAPIALINDFFNFTIPGSVWPGFCSLNPVNRQPCHDGCEKFQA